mgnify:CR=1 FL=1
MKRFQILFLTLCCSLIAVADDVLPEEQLYFTVSASRTHVYEQEAVLLTYTFHAFGTMGLSVGINKPDFEGLVSQEIPQPENKSVYTETVGGRVGRAGVVKQTIVFPQRAGTIVVPGLTFNCEVHIGQGDLSGLGPKITLKRRVPNLTLQVDALPQPAPKAFGGAVGRFDVTTNVSHNTLRTGDIATYSVTISGQGNLRLITPARLNFPDSFDIFDTTTDDNTHISKEGMSGSVTFRYPFMPRTKGRFTMPADTFCYFNPATREYVSVALPPVELNVEKGLRTEAEIEAEAALRESGIRADRQEDANAWTKNWGIGHFLGGLLLLIIFYFAADTMWQRHNARKQQMLGVRGARVRAEKEIARAKQLINTGDYYAALSVLTHCLTHFAQEHIANHNSETATLSPGEMGERLLSEGFSAESVALWQTLLRDIDTAAFAPRTSDNALINTLADRASEVVHIFDTKS